MKPYQLLFLFLLAACTNQQSRYSYEDHINFIERFNSSICIIDSLYYDRSDTEDFYNLGFKIGLLTGHQLTLDWDIRYDYAGWPQETIYYDDSIYERDKAIWLKWFEKNNQSMTIKKANDIIDKNYIRFYIELDSIVGKIPQKYLFILTD